jgi:hypothetical protein
MIQEAFTDILQILVMELNHIAHKCLEGQKYVSPSWIYTPIYHMVHNICWRITSSDTRHFSSLQFTQGIWKPISNTHTWHRSYDAKNLETQCRNRCKWSSLVAFPKWVTAISIPVPVLRHYLSSQPVEQMQKIRTTGDYFDSEYPLKPLERKTYETAEKTPQ